MTAPLAVYSFADVKLTIIGPGINATCGGDGSGSAKEGITIEPISDKNTMTEGADAAMHSLNVVNTAKATVRLLKTSPVNALLNSAYNLQKSVSGLWGQNIITCTNAQVGDLLTCLQSAFSRHTPVNYGSEGGVNTWEFHVANYQPVLGTGNFNSGATAA